MGEYEEKALRIFPAIAFIAFFLSLIFPWYRYEGVTDFYISPDGTYQETSWMQGEVGLLWPELGLIKLSVSLLFCGIGITLLILSCYYVSSKRRWSGGSKRSLIFGMIGNVFIITSIVIVLSSGYQVGDGIPALLDHATNTIYLIVIGMLFLLIFSILHLIRSHFFTLSVEKGRVSSFGRIAMIILGGLAIMFPLFAIFYLFFGIDQVIGIGGQLVMLAGMVFLTLSVIAVWRSKVSNSGITRINEMIASGNLDDASSLLRSINCSHKAAELMYAKGDFEESARDYERNGFWEEARNTRARTIQRKLATSQPHHFELDAPKDLINPFTITSSVLIIASLLLLVISILQPVWITWDYDSEVPPDGSYADHSRIVYQKETGLLSSNMEYRSWGVDEEGNETFGGYTFGSTDRFEYSEERSFNIKFNETSPRCSIFLPLLIPMIFFDLILIGPAIMIALKRWSGAVGTFALVLSLIFILVFSILTIALFWEEHEMWIDKGYGGWEEYPEEVAGDVFSSMELKMGFILALASGPVMLIGAIMSIPSKPVRKLHDKARLYAYTLNLAEAKKYYSKIGMDKTAEYLDKMIQGTKVTAVEVKDEVPVQ